MPTRTILVFIVGLLAAGASFAQAYKWVDKDGVVHYSDRPEPGAQEINLPTTKPARRTSSRTTASAAMPAEAAPAQPERPFRYESLSVAAPGAEETLWNIEGILNVSLSLSPALQPGHRVRVYFDGTPQPATGTSFQLQEVYRGTHNLQAEILDANGTLMIRSAPTRFYVQQTSILRQR